jgi:hypothetical protein
MYDDRPDAVLCRRWRIGPPTSALGQASNHPELRWPKTVVVSVREKAASSLSGGDREDVPESRLGGAFGPGRVSPLRRRQF